MDKLEVAGDLSDLQDVFARMMTLKLYTAMCFAFPLDGSVSRDQVTRTLRGGLEVICTSFPWLAAQITTLDGSSKMVPLEKTSWLILKDVAAIVPSFDHLRSAGFPFSMLDGETLGPLSGLPTIKWPSGDTTAPVFFIQANFIDGGLLLNFMGEHTAMDGQGLGQVIRLFSKACHGEPFSDEEVLHGNRARTHIVPLLDRSTYQPGPELEHLTIKANAAKPPAVEQAAQAPKCTWAYLNLSESSLLKLKARASTSDSVAHNRAVPYISTNDAATAFIWQSISRARASRLAPDATTMLVRAIDMRSALSIPPTYLGNLHHHTYTKLPVQSLASTSLSSVASELRSALNPSELNYAIRSFATQYTFSEDKSQIRYGADVDMSTDIWFSSWAKLPSHDHDFNLGLGLAEAVRRPSSHAIEGLVYLMPMDRTGRLAVALCLRDEDVAALRSDALWAEHTEWIG